MLQLLKAIIVLVGGTSSIVRSAVLLESKERNLAGKCILNGTLLSPMDGCSFVQAAGADANARVFRGFPSTAAAQEGHLKALQVLLEQGKLNLVSCESELSAMILALVLKSIRPTCRSRLLMPFFNECPTDIGYIRTSAHS